MCKITEYPGLYAKVTQYLRLEGIHQEIAGFEILRNAIIIYKVEGKLPKEKFLQKIEEVTFIPANRDLNPEKLEKKERNMAMQWMIEAIAAAGLIPEDEDMENKSDKEKILMLFIEEMAAKL